ncbi:probable ATP-dependent RNA helicase DDX52 [Neodiprion fabricii]|uniref:probable ATP-dependent RNA helicase DDX52 n=1 Tax=Neodiprion fabricii TaxID=2872261 RepID=UPI001ED975D9|nr:probable ATP-dependent RNA helicase DDX52 [Neodiprion fabricii]
MDAHDLFKKLSVGAKFDTKRFRRDAEKFKLVKTSATENVVQIKEEPKDEDEPLGVPEKRKWVEDEDGAGNLTLVGDISVPKDGSKRKHKKQKKELTVEKQNQLGKEKINQLRNSHHISVIGRHVPAPIEEFDQLSSRYQVASDLIQNIKNCHYKEPTPIQMQALPILIEGRQLLACAPTGSGKTAAFLVPIVNQLKGPQKKGFRAIIVSPTRELAKQTYRECLRIGEGRGFRVHIISNINQAMSKYGPKSSQKFDILITTPNRLVYLLNQDPPAISLKNVEWLIVDEADKLFEEGIRGFKDQLDQIQKACTNENLCRAMFSATNTPAVTKWCRQNLKGLITITVGHRNSATNLVTQELLFVGSEGGKLVAFRNIIQKGMMPPVLVFVQSKERAQELFNELIYDGINVDVIHADRTQTQRDNVVRCFREGKIWVLICTELMGRGIDFKGVNLVINYDFPPSAISYIHRIGRTGRAGHRGKAITFFTQDDTINLRSIATVMRDSGCEVPDYMLSMKKHNKKEKRELERRAPQRDKISTIPTYEDIRKEKQRKRLERSIKGKEGQRKLVENGDNLKENTINSQSPILNNKLKKEGKKFPGQLLVKKKKLLHKKNEKKTNQLLTNKTIKKRDKRNVSS